MLGPTLATCRSVLGSTMDGIILDNMLMMPALSSLSILAKPREAISCLIKSMAAAMPGLLKFTVGLGM